MIKRINNWIKKHNMLEEGDKVVIGVSGGADSVCLFYLLLLLKESYHLELFVVHVNHGLRLLDAEEDERYVVQLCKTHGIPYKIVSKDVAKVAEQIGCSEEEGGRIVRYEAFYQVLKEINANKIAVAHHKNDQAETVLFHLARGSGLRGMAGMKPISGEIIRPLLEVTRKEIEDFLEQNQISYQTDETNFTEKYTRNKIRLNLLPYMTEKINAKSVEHIASTSGMLREVQEYIEKNAKFAFGRIVIEKKGQYSFLIENFLEEDIVIQKEMIRMILFSMAKQQRDLNIVHIQAVLQLLYGQVGKQIDLPYHICAEKGYEEIIFYKKEAKKAGRACLKQEIIPPCQYFLEDLNCNISFEILEVKNSIISLKEEDQDAYAKKNLVIPKNNCTKWFDYDKISNTAFLRNRESGDYIQINNHGSHKKLKEYFIDAKIPREKRETIPLLADGSHILWIIGERISEYYKVSKDTTRILVVKINGGIEHGR